ncbi:MAG: PilC/PilY family type IV pilus protein [Lautropia sp.]
MDRPLIRLLAALVTSGSVLVLAAGAGSAQAEDIDIYMSMPPSSDLPNILFILDNSANWSASLPVPRCVYKNVPAGVPDGPPDHEQSKKIGLEKCALHNVIDALGNSEVPLANVGLMLFNESPAANSGGYPRIAFTPVNGQTREQLKERVRAISLNEDKGNNAAFAKSLHEAYLYFSGAAPYVGAKGSKFDPAAFEAGRYRSPAAGSCSRNYIVFIGNGGPGEVTDNEAKALLAGAGGDVAPLVYPGSIVANSDQANWADEYTRFLAASDVSTKDSGQAITTYGVAVTGAASDGKFPNFIKAMATQGGGKYYQATTVDGLEKFLLDIITGEVAAVDSAFVSANLPVSVSNRGTYLNQVFMGLFRPDANASPRWRGNLKQYQFSYDPVTDSLQLADSRGEPAINPATGFFSPTSESYWSSASTYWSNQLLGIPPSSSDLPDGAVVAKGGAAQQLRERHATSLEGRKVYTCLSCAPGIRLGAGEATRFLKTNAGLTAAMLGTTAEARPLLIDWVRGQDNAGDEKGPGGTTIVRPSIHGDVLHSRPAVVNYGGSTGVVVFYGANNGMLQAINGNKSGIAQGVEAGGEYWSFVPEEGIPKLKRLMNETPRVEFASTPSIALPETEPRDYFFDGQLSFYQKLSSSGSTEKVYLYAGMRRGGRALYAFDVTNPTEPVFMWKAVPSAQMPLGQTWSEAKVAMIKGHSNPVIVMGAGYDAAAEDLDPPGPVTMGNAVLVLDAVTGELLKKFSTSRPVPGEVALVDSDYDGRIDRGYVADLGGKIYRLDLENGGSSAKADWTLTTFADLSASGARKFFFAPDVVLTRDYAVVMIGSGDREKPLDKTTAESFFTLIDVELGKGVSDGFAPITYADVVARENFASAEAPRGCFITMDPAGEKVVNAAVTAGGITYFSTNRPTPPSPNSCTGTLGEAKVYGVPLICQAGRSEILRGGGLPPGTVTGIVAIDVGRAADGSPQVRRMPFLIGGFNFMKSGIEGSKVPVAVPPRRKRLYWYNESER